MKNTELIENRAEKKRAYNEFLRDILKRSDTLDAEAITGIRRLILDMQERIVGRIGGELSRGNAFRTDGEGKLTDWGLFWIPRLIRATSDIVDKLAKEAGAELGDYLAKAWELGAELVDGTIEAVRPGTSIAAERINKYTLTTLAPFSAQLITRIDEATRAAIDKAIKVNVATGESPSVLMDRLERDLQGQDSPFKSVAYRAEIVTRTEVARVQSLGREARMQQMIAEFPELIQGDDGFKYRFISVHRGEYPCKICEPYDQTVWDIDDPARPETPLHPNCFPGFVTAAPIGELEAVFRRPYEGPMVEVFVSGATGPRLTVTPNHPIMTQRGWVPAGELNELDYLVCYTGVESDSSACDESLREANVNDPEASFEEIFHSLSVSNLVERVVDRPANFHGDGHTEEVEIVWADRQLGDSLDSGILEPLSNSELVLANSGSTVFTGSGTLSKSLSSVASRSQSLPFLEGESLHSEGVCLGGGSSLDSGFTECIADTNPGTVESFRDFKLRDPFFVKADELGVKVREVSSQLNTVLFENPKNSILAHLQSLGNGRHAVAVDVKIDDVGCNLVPPRSLRNRDELGPRSFDSEVGYDSRNTREIDSDGFSDFVSRFTSQISFLNVNRINVFTFSGHVYNLQTSLGYYTTSYGIITKNCRCEWTPHLPGVSTGKVRPRADRQAAASITECNCCS